MSSIIPVGVYIPLRLWTCQQQVQKMNYSQSIIERLQKEKNLSQSDIAEIFGVKQPFIAKVKAGEKHLSQENGLKAGDVLGISDEEIIMNLGMEKAKTERERNAWLKLMTGTAAAALLTTTGAIPLIDTIAHNVYLFKCRFGRLVLTFSQGFLTPAKSV